MTRDNLAADRVTFENNYADLYRDGSLLMGGLYCGRSPIDLGHFAGMVSVDGHTFDLTAEPQALLKCQVSGNIIGDEFVPQFLDGLTLTKGDYHPLLEVDGIGPNSLPTLANSGFHCPTDLKLVTEKEIHAVPGISAALAARIKANVGFIDQNL